MHARCGMKDCFGSGDLNWFSGRTKPSILGLKTTRDYVNHQGRINLFGGLWGYNENDPWYTYEMFKADS